LKKTILIQFLKAGFIYKRHLNPTKAGTPQGGILSHSGKKVQFVELGTIVRIYKMLIREWSSGSDLGEKSKQKSRFFES